LYNKIVVDIFCVEYILVLHRFHIRMRGNLKGSVRRVTNR